MTFNKKDRSKGTKILVSYNRSDSILRDKHFEFIRQNWDTLNKIKDKDEKYAKYVDLCKTEEFFNDGELYTILNSKLIHSSQVGLLLYQLVRQRLKTDFFKKKHWWVAKKHTFYDLDIQVWSEKYDET